MLYIYIIRITLNHDDVMHQRYIYGVPFVIDFSNPVLTNEKKISINVYPLYQRLDDEETESKTIHDQIEQVFDLNFLDHIA